MENIGNQNKDWKRLDKCSVGLIGGAEVGVI